jgi:hypothetical protein
VPRIHLGAVSDWYIGTRSSSAYIADTSRNPACGAPGRCSVRIGGGVWGLGKEKRVGLLTERRNKADTKTSEEAPRDKQGLRSGGSLQNDTEVEDKASGSHETNSATK